MKKLLVSICLLAAFPAFALDLHSARASGAVVEKPTGYIEAVQTSPEIEALVSDVNTKRQAEYARIAKEKGQPVETVAKLAAQELRKKK